jgi:hypothetical protein
LVSLVHFEPFQRVTATPRQKSFWLSSRCGPPRAGRGSFVDEGRISWILFSEKKKSTLALFPAKIARWRKPGARSIRERPRLCLLRHNLTHLTDLRPTFRRNGLRIDFFAQ